MYKTPYNHPMGNRLSKITTRTGDRGDTGLADGSRLSKAAPRIQAIGDVDELNSSIGVLLVQLDGSAYTRLLSGIQHRLFDLGGELAIPGHQVIDDAHVSELEQAVETLNETLEPLKEFILPGGSPAAAACHLSRTVCRRAERALVALRADSDNTPSSQSLAYLNRLSDLLFVLARVLNREADRDDVLWRPTPKP